MTKMRLISIFLLLLGSISLSLSSETDASKINWLGSAPDGTWTEEWFEAMPVDHYDLVNTDTFKMRYFINLHHYEEGGPIFFYCGNEGYIEFYIHATGQILEMAAEQKGAVVYAEHRFYGKTQPFGNESLSSAENLGYLTSMQALSDYALFIGHLKNTRIPGAKNSSVVAFGGSYGGMLATFFRAKYPHIVDMAVASCAPIYMFTDNGKSNNSYYYRDLTNIFVEAGCSKEAIYNSWGALRRLAKTAEGRAKLNQIFRLAKVSQIEIEGDIEILLGVFQQVLIDISMSDFPFETTAFNVMPAWPVNRSCVFFKDLKKSDEEYAEAMFQMVNLNKNWEGDRKEFCLKPGACPDDDKIGALKGWNWQICTEFVLPMCTQGLPNDFFENSCPFKSETNAESCTAVFKSIGYQPEMMSPHFTAVEYGLQLPTASRIIFTNGLRDPCINGGWSSTPKVEGSLVSLIVKDGSHMYDLCGSHVNDTESVKEVRKEIRRYLDKWLREMDGKPSTRGALSGLLPSFLLSLAVMLCIY